ncbi:MAG: GGDEF domain-containing protein [Paraglaciecola sp.]|uniref:GGDEF domain-containing protein n=1 Tax=Paraglaciecola sp. TaxID=1920173 RepID=UPI00273D8B54|nr:GGDEF domain-containing protein [Paraglaciecola sp.]MDP5032773.1 GGDEF domain-containing protein [Paraglaciecola sp.]MDP5130577.1 GGDEF domain-containing protein [Paraglaciecola sp.]
MINETWPKSVNENIEPQLDNLMGRSDHDFEANSRAGLFVYIVAWTVMLFGTGFYQQQPLLSLQLSIVLVTITLFRLCHILLHQYVYFKLPKRWMLLHYGLLLTHGAFWSVLFTLAIIDERFSVLLLALVMFIAIIAGGAVASFRAKFLVPQLYVAIMLVPAMIFSMLKPELNGICWIIMLHWFFLISFGYRLNKDYRNAYKQELDLQVQKQNLDLLSKTDSLTKIYNRQYFTDCFEYQWKLAIRNESVIALLMIDVDDFRGISLKHGPVFGDKCLVHVADIIRDSVKRVTDLVVRYGGEQFVVILTETQADVAQKLAEQIRQNILSKDFVHADHTQFLSATIGVGVIKPKQFSSSTLLIQKAEIALYQAKVKGQNRVEVM